MTELYSTGTIAVTEDSVDFVGTGTAWLPVNAKSGDTLNVAGHVVLIAEISDPTHGKFAIPYPGETAAALPYAIAKTSSEWGTNRTLALQTAEMIQLLTTIVVERTGIAFDAYGSLAGRDAHDDKPAGFVYLAVTPGPWTLYIKLSGDTADWDAGQTMEGAPGPSNVLTIGTVEDGEDADASITGASPDQQLNLVLPRGAASTVPGPANELTIGTVEDGVTADATITGEAPNQVLNLQLPKGDTGDAATVTVGTVTTVEPTEPASVTNSGTPGAAVFDFEIPKGPPGSGSVDSVNGDPGPDIVLDADDIDDAATTHKFATAAQLAAVDALGSASTRNTGTGAGNVPVLDGAGLLDESILPALAITDTFEVANQTAMLALTAQRGDIAVRSDINKSFVLKATPANTLANWVELRTPTDAVLSVIGLTGAISQSALKAAMAMAKADVGLGNVDNTSDATKNSAAATLTNKRITSRTASMASSATPAVNTDNYDAVTITALATAVTSMSSSLAGTPTDLQKLIYRIKDNGSARAIAWGTSFEARGAELPTTTVAGKVLTVGFIYDAATSKWGCVAVAQEA